MLAFPPAALAYFLFVTLLLGLVFGSFGHAWAWRLVHGEKIQHGRSHCPACGHTLAARDLVPLFSWLALRGKCRYCGAPISPRYPASEALCAAVFLSFLLRFGFTPQTLFYCILGFCLFVLSLVDLESCLIPDRFLVAAACNFLLYAALTRDAALLRRGLWGGFILAASLLALVLLMDKVLHRETMGGGDIKLLFVLGLYTGAAGGLLLVILGCVIGLLFALIPGIRGRDAENPRAIPFGPSLALAGWFVLLFGDAIITWYLHFF